MKKALAVAVIAVVILLLTNPNLSAHKSAVLERSMSGLNTAEHAGMKSRLGSAYIANSISQSLEERIGRTNFGLFSLTKSTTLSVLDRATAQPTASFVGIGILGQVYVWGEE